MDEVDAITPKRETSSRGMEKRIVAQVRVPLAVLGFLGRCSCFGVAHAAFADVTRHRLGTLNGCPPQRIRCDATACCTSMCIIHGTIVRLQKVGRVALRDSTQTESRAPLERHIHVSAHNSLNLAFSLFLSGTTMHLQLLTCMDSLTIENTGGKPVVVIGATNRPNDLDSALRRAGRFDREICLGVPDLAARARILQVLQKQRYALTFFYVRVVCLNRRTSRLAL